MDNIIGHNSIRSYFKEAINSGTLSHAHLFVGEDGIGKSLLAREFAVRILGKTEVKQYVDIMEFRSSKNKKSIGVDEIRSIIEEIGKKPYEHNKKVIIIYEGDNITVQAQNAFLKTIEEPPAGVYIFVLCENLEVVLDTIKSRCQIHKLNRLKGEEIEQFLHKKYPELRGEEFETVLSFSDGIPGRAEKFVEDKIFKELRNTTTRLLLEITSMKESQVLGYEALLIKYKDIAEEMFTLLLTFIRDIMIYKDVGIEELIINKDKLQDIKEASTLLSYNKLTNIIDVINTTRDNLRSNVNAALTYDVMLLKMLDA